MDIDWRPLVKVINERDHFLITSHLRADCDALGSEVALAQILQALGKQVAIVNGDEPPPHIAFMDPEGRIGVLGSTVTLDLLRSFEVMIVVDTSAWIQLGRMADVMRDFPGV